MSDTMYPPHRRYAGAGQNTLKMRQKPQNTYRTAPEQAAEPLGLNPAWVVLGLAVGGLAAYIASRDDTGAGSGTGTNAGTGTNTGTTTGTGSGTTTKPKRPAIVPIGSPREIVFVDSLLGETIYERLRTTPAMPHGYGMPSSSILLVPNKTMLGYRTGREYQPSAAYPRMIQLFCQFADGTQYNYWVDEEQTVTCPEAVVNTWLQYDFKKMDAITSNAIKTYFAARYTL